MWPAALAWSPDGAFILATCDGPADALGHFETVRVVLDARTLRVVAQSWVENGSRCAAWSPDGSLLAVTGADRSLAVYGFRHNAPASVWARAPLAQLHWASARDALAGCAFSPTSGQLATLVDDIGTGGSPNIPAGSYLAVLWSTASWRVAGVLPGLVRGNGIAALAWSPDGRMLAAGEAGMGSARLWRRAGGAVAGWPSWELRPGGATLDTLGFGLTWVAWLPRTTSRCPGADQDCLVAGSLRGVDVYAHLVPDGRPTWTWHLAGSSPYTITGMAALTDGRVAVATEHPVFLLSTAAGQQIRSWESVPSSTLGQTVLAAASPDGRMLAVTNGRDLIVYEVGP
jgi:WD40 repeat protein